MKLKEALVTGWVCGLTTVGEAIDNIVLNYLSMVPYDIITKEENELEDDLEYYFLSDGDLIDKTLIKDSLKFFFDINTEDIDRKLENELQAMSDEQWRPD